MNILLAVTPSIMQFTAAFGTCFCPVGPVLVEPGICLVMVSDFLNIPERGIKIVLLYFFLPLVCSHAGIRATRGSRKDGLNGSLNGAAPRAQARPERPRHPTASPGSMGHLALLFGLRGAIMPRLGTNEKRKKGLPRIYIDVITHARHSIESSPCAGPSEARPVLDGRWHHPK